MSGKFLNNRKNLLAKLGITNTNKIKFFTQGTNGAIYKYYNKGNNQPPKILKFGRGPHANESMINAILRNKREYFTLAAVHTKLGKLGENIFVPAVHGFASNEKLGSLSVMNFVKGETLREISKHLETRHYEQIYKKLRKIVKVLVDKLGIIHGDLHDGNIIIEPVFNINGNVKNFNIKLIDFGRSRTKDTGVKNIFLLPRIVYIGCKNGSRVCHLPHGYRNNSRLPTMISNEAAINILFGKKKYSSSLGRLMMPNNKSPVKPPKNFHRSENML